MKRQATEEERAEILAIISKRPTFREPITDGGCSIKVWVLDRRRTLAAEGNLAAFADDGTAVKRLLAYHLDGEVLGELLVF